MKQSITFLIGTILASGLAVSCNSSDVKSTPVKQDIVVVQPVETIKSSTKGQYAKPGAPVDISYTSGKTANTGDAIIINATLHLNAFDLEQVAVQVNPDNAITLFDSPGQNFLLPLAAGQRDYPLQFTASNNALGIQYIHVIAQTTRAGQKRSRAFSIPLQAGSDMQAKTQLKGNATEIDGTGVLVAPMTAEETIKPTN